MLPFLALILAGLIFLVGLMGLAIRRNMFFSVLSLEIMLNAVNIVFVAADRYHGKTAGQSFVLFVFVIAAAEVLTGVIFLLAWYRLRSRLSTDDMRRLEE